MKNIRLVYILAFLYKLLFWLAVWVFYYLLFTDYAGIGLIEAVMALVFVVMEVPSGALADLIGRKRSLVLAFFLIFAGNMLMAFAPTYAYLILSAVIISVGFSFYSGTAEALAYDTLKIAGQAKEYDKVISRIKGIEALALSLASAAGGFLYFISFNLPFVATGLAGFVGMVVALFLVEPAVDSEKFSWAGFWAQNKQGLGQLAKTKHIRRLTWLLLSIAFITTICFEMLEDILAVEFGFQAHQLGLFWAVVTLSAGLASQLTPILKRKFNIRFLYMAIGTVIATALFVSPWAGFLAGALSIFIRDILLVVFDNLTSIIINNNTESRFRATTISTFNLARSIPYIFVAYFIGYIMDVFSGRVFAAGLGAMLFISLLVAAFVLKPDKMEADLTK